jgi:thiol-disulfide isomerase/thioredoxin
LAGGAVAAGVALFLAARFLSGGAGASLAALESASLPLDSALRNGKPTLVEFYAPWCDACRELAPVERDLQQRFGASVNFVLLDVDNPLWQQEVEEYRVSGIPHFVFLDQKGEALAAAVGRVPGRVLEANVAAMAEDNGGGGTIELPFLAERAEASALRAAGGGAAAVGVDAAAPRAHA